MARLRLNGTQHLKGGEAAWQGKEGRIRNDAAFPMSYAPQDGWSGDPINGNWIRMNTPTNGDDEDLRKLNPNLIDPPGAALHVGYQRMTQHRQEKRHDICS
ncbi:MAG: hypothetical protein JWR80_1895 [Bradyrhizobium sp.]|nr:hypothetical protein [Bradyrhizobium sp.]